MAPVPVPVARITKDYAGVATLDIDMPNGAPFPFEPGQFNMLYAFGLGEVAISISGDPADPERLVHTIHDVGPVTHALTHVEPGDYIGLRGPFGSTWPVDEAKGRDVLVIAGGLGLAPVRPIVYRLLKNKQDYGEVSLLYGTRTPDTVLYDRELGRLAFSGGMNVHVTVDHADTGWTGNVGVVTTLIDRATFDPANTTAFICGPEIMMRFAVRSCTDAGIPPEAIHLSMERNMKCAIKQCGRCQLGPVFVCQDGPVFPLPKLAPYLNLREF